MSISKALQRLLKGIVFKDWDSEWAMSIGSDAYIWGISGPRPQHPKLVYAWWESISMFNTCHSKLMWYTEGGRLQMQCFVGAGLKRPSADLSEIFISKQAALYVY